MDSIFSLMDRHLDAPRPARRNGRVVLSRLPAGRSVIAAPAASVKFVLEGEEAYEVDGRVHRVRAGQFLYLDRGSDSYAVLRSSSVGLCVALPCDEQPVPVGDPVIGRGLVLSARTSRLGQMLLAHGRRLAKDPEGGAALSHDVIRAVQDAIGEPLKESRALIGAIDAAKPATRQQVYQRIEIARAHLHEVVDRPVTLPELSKVAGLSQFYLARLFKAAFGTSPAAYHRRLRLRTAADLLSGGASVIQVAEATGYADQVSLTHAFRRHFGLPPVEWLRRSG